MIVREHLNEVYPGRWIGRCGEGDNRAATWPPRSCDMTPCDFCVWGVLKKMVYAGEEIHTREELLERILAAFRALPAETIRNATRSVDRRAEMCIGVEGGQFQQLLRN